MSVGEKYNWQHSIAHSRKPLYRHKNLAKISYARRVTAHFVPNFVAMAMGVGRGKMQLAAFDGPSPKTPYRRKNLAKISYASRVTAHFIPNFVAMGVQGHLRSSMLTPIKSLSLLLVMISSMSLPICNRVHARRDNCSKITTF